MSRKLNCPRCNEPIEVESAVTADLVVCPSCNQRIRLKKPTDDGVKRDRTRQDAHAVDPREMADGSLTSAAAFSPFVGSGVSKGDRPKPGGGGDVRPMIPRNTTNIINTIDCERDQIYDFFMEVCEAEGVEALVLKSDPYSTSTWVKFECWLPHHSTGGMTDRSTVLINFRSRPYHRYEYEMDIDLQDGLKPIKYKAVVAFTRSDALAIVRYLLRRSPARTPDFRLTLLREKWWQFWRDRNKVTRLRTDYRPMLAGALIVIGILSFAIGGFLLVVAGIVLVILNARRRGFVLSCGKPPQEPRDLSLRYRWRVLIPELGEKTEDLKKDLRRELLRGKVDDTIKMVEERIWHWGLDGKEERDQLTASFRRGIAFIQVHPYDKDLSVSWDSYLNLGTWGEEDVASGIDTVTGEFTRVKTIKVMRQYLSEYEVSDVECLSEWVHNAMVKVVKLYIEEYKIDMEIDFRINRDKENLPGSKAGRDRPDDGMISLVKSFLQRQA